MVHKHQLETSAKNNKMRKIASSQGWTFYTYLPCYFTAKKKKKKGLQKIDKTAQIKNDTIIKFLVAI